MLIQGWGANASIYGNYNLYYITCNVLNNNSIQKQCTCISDLITVVTKIINSIHDGPLTLLFLHVILLNSSPIDELGEGA